MTWNWTAIGTIGTMVGLIVAVLMARLAFKQFSHQVGGLQKQLQLQVMFEYTRRYDEVIEQFPVSIRHDGMHAAPASFAEKKEIMSAFRRYVNLCSEEFVLHQDGLIGGTLWTVWEREMNANLRSEFGRLAWEKLKKGGHYASYGEFTGYVDAVVLDSPDKLES